MKKFSVLDCTLRDGGYVNNWEFGRNNITNIISKLSESNLDIIECGFLSNIKSFGEDESRFNSIEKIEKYLMNYNSNCMYVCMINYGEYSIDDIPTYSGGVITGIRIVFHQSEIEDAVEFSKQIKDKGYKVFIQPMVTINYTDIELLELVTMVNKITPFAFYIVDSFGVMKQSDLTRMFYIIDNNLDNSIYLGYHSHNNMQLAYSNAQALVQLQSCRNIIIDASVFGMGRGAGNLNTELFTEYLNNNYGSSYNIKCFLEIIDYCLKKIYADNYWGYSLEHYLSASVNCHPNYASYLSDKNVLSVSAISDILRLISASKKNSYDKNYIEELYKTYQNNSIDDNLIIDNLKTRFSNQEILILAPGKSLIDEKQNIELFIERSKCVVLSVNFISSEFKIQVSFFSNAKRFDYFNEEVSKHKDSVIITSNINKDDFTKVNYASLLNNKEFVTDNATLMLIKLLIKCNVRKIYFAGFDGYNDDFHNNYFDKDIELVNKTTIQQQMNIKISEFLSEISRTVNVEFITPTKYYTVLNKDK